MKLFKVIDLSSIFNTIKLKKLDSFKQKYPLFIEKNNYIIKTAETKSELIRILQLRYEIFYEELLGKRLVSKLDFDNFDLISDHLCVIDKRNNKLIGTYRLISSKFSKKFYSQTEFEMNAVFRLKGNKLELGRACVHKDFRNGITIALLWQGIQEYSRISESDYIFGCSSVKTTKIQEIQALNKYLNEKYKNSNELQVSPKSKFKVDQLKTNALVSPEFNPEFLLPPLLKAYLNSGACICGQPAFDKKFKCVDYFTLLDMNKIKIRNRQKEQCLSQKAVS